MTDKTQPLTEQIKDMSPEEIAELNKDLSRKMVKRFAIAAAATAVALLAINHVAKSVTDSDEEKSED